MKVQTPELGGIVKSRYGRDKGRLYLIVRAEGRTLYLADGRYRGYKNPKKKKKTVISAQRCKKSV